MAHPLAQPLSPGPSDWVVRWAREIAKGGRVLDVAAGSGRHARYLLERGFRVEAVDRDTSALQQFANNPNLVVRAADLEAGPWPFSGVSFDGIVVANYLHRPLFPALLTALAPGGVLIYETFMAGNEGYGRPSNPDFLLRANELLAVVGPAYAVLAFQQGYSPLPKPAMVQRICARKKPPGS